MKIVRKRETILFKNRKFEIEKKIEQAIETTKMKKKFVESLINSHFESFVFFSSVIDFVFVFVNVSKKNENLFDENKVIEIFFCDKH